MWNGTVELADGKIHLPFRMFLDLRSRQPNGYFLVGDEKAPIPELTRQNDSVTFTFSEYGAEIRATWTGRAMIGTYIRHRPEGLTSLNFSATPELSPTGRPSVKVTNVPSGKYRVRFEDPNSRESATVATLWMNGNLLYGTFIAPDGDYGLLAGDASGGKLQLNRFTGWQAIAITLDQSAGAWSGNFYFLNDKPRPFKLEPAPGLDVETPADLQTSMKDPEAGFKFDGISVSGETVRSTDTRFQGVPLIVDIMGTWCHNCVDEAPLLEELQRRYEKIGLKVVGISFEIANDAEVGKKNLKLYKDRLGLSYTLLFCGSIDDNNVNQRLHSQLNHFFAYPTALFIDRKGKVQTMHTGFKGPGTGEEFQAQIREFRELAEKLVR